MSSSLDRLFEEAREDGSLRHWEIGDTVVVHTLNDLVGEVTRLLWLLQTICQDLNSYTISERVVSITHQVI